MKTITFNEENLRTVLDEDGVSVEVTKSNGISVVNLTWDQFDKLKNLPWCTLEGVVRPPQQKHLGSDLGFPANSAQWNAVADQMNRWRPVSAGAYGYGPIGAQTGPSPGDDPEGEDPGKGEGVR